MTPAARCTRPLVGLALAVVVGLASCLPRGHLLPGDPTAGGPGDLDPRDYDSFEEFRRYAPAPLSDEYLRERWDRVHAGDVQHPVVPDPEDLPEPVPEGVDLGETPLVEYEGSEQIRFALGWSVHDATGRTIPDQRFDGSPTTFERELKRYYGGDPIAVLVEHGFTVGYFIPHRGGGQFGGNAVSRDGALLWAVAPMREWRVGGDYFTLIPLPVPLGKAARRVGWAVRGGARVVVYAGRIAAHAVTAVGKRARHIAHAAPAVRAAYRTARAVIHGASGRGAHAAGAAGRSGSGHAGRAAGRTAGGHAAGASNAAGRAATGRAGRGAASAATGVPKVHMGKQGKHIVGHPNYTPGRSVLRANPAELAKRAGTGTPVNKVPWGQAGFKERVQFDYVIGDFVKDGVATPTRNGIITYAKDGSIHIIPAAP